MSQQKVGFLKSKIQEIKKITWTKPKTLFKNVGIVILFTSFFTLSIFLVDTFISYILNLIINLL